MKFSLTSLALIGMICFVGVGVTGCGGGGEATVIEATEEVGTMDQSQEDEYEKAMMEAMNESAE